MSDRPILHCLVAPPLSDGRVKGNPMLVSLVTAEWLVNEFGWAMIGPDPVDEIDLATWEREQVAVHKWPRWS